jgi:hypothetical protein
LRNGWVGRSLPPFADALDYLALADEDRRLWRSLPFMLAFGHEQVEAIMATLDVARPRRPDVLRLAAAFSAGMSVFDYLVDETPHRESAFSLERLVVPRIFGRGPGAREALARAYRHSRGGPMRLMCALFWLWDEGFRQLRDAGGKRRAWQALGDTVTELARAERRHTRARARARGALARLAPVSRAKSVLPFIAMLDIAVLASGRERAPADVAGAVTRLGEAIARIDDLTDLLDDAARGAPSPTLLALLDWVEAGGRQCVTDRDILDLVDHETAAITALLASGFDGHAPVEGLARRAVARWAR